MENEKTIALLERIAGALEAQTEVLKTLSVAPHKSATKKTSTKYSSVVSEDKEWESLRGQVQDVFATDKVIKYDVDIGSDIVKVVIFANHFTKEPALANYDNGDKIWVKGEWKDNVFRGKTERQFIVRGLAEESAPSDNPAAHEIVDDDDDVPF